MKKSKKLVSLTKGAGKRYLQSALNAENNQNTLVAKIIKVPIKVILN